MHPELRGNTTDLWSVFDLRCAAIKVIAIAEMEER